MHAYGDDGEENAKAALHALTELDGSKPTVVFFITDAGYHRTKRDSRTAQAEEDYLVQKGVADTDFYVMFDAVRLSKGKTTNGGGGAGNDVITQCAVASWTWTIHLAPVLGTTCRFRQPRLRLARMVPVATPSGGAMVCCIDLPGIGAVLRCLRARGHGERLSRV